MMVTPSLILPDQNAGIQTRMKFWDSVFLLRGVKCRWQIKRTRDQYAELISSAR